LIEKNKKLTAELAEAHSEWKKEGESRLFENKKLKEELDTALEELETALDEGQDLVIEKLEEENEKLKEELAGFKKNMRAVLNMIEYTIGGGSDVSMKINDILWSGGDTFYEKDE
jgi:FtsZ-binding cell division protein ZapB